MKPNQAFTIDRSHANCFRAQNHNLARRLPVDRLIEAAAACGMQNTPPGSAELALSARVTGLVANQVQGAIEEDKSLLQAWSLRAAPYVFPTGDAAVFTGGMLPEDEESIRAFVFGVEPALDKIEISAVEVVEKTRAAMQAILSGRAMTKDELGIELSAWISPGLTPSQRQAWQMPSVYAAGQSLGESVVRFALPIAALHGLCCHAERRGNQAFFRLTGEWLGYTLPPVPSDQSRAELVRRYLKCFGPSTPEHFADWAGMSRSQAGRAWQLVQAELVEGNFAGRQTWLLEQDLDRLRNPAPAEAVRFLPPHDPFLGLRDRKTLIPEKEIQRRIWRTTGNPGVILAGSELAATWQPRKQGQRLHLLIKPFVKLSDQLCRTLEEEAQLLGPLRGCSVVVVKIDETTEN